MSEPTYLRYKRALEQIVEGADDPITVATEALRSLRAEPTYAWKQDAEARRAIRKEKQAEDRRVCLKLYNEWLIAGRPPIQAFAKTKGISKSSMLRKLERAERGMPRNEMRLDWFARDGKAGYPTADEVWKLRGYDC